MHRPGGSTAQPRAPKTRSSRTESPRPVHQTHATASFARSRSGTQSRAHPNPTHPAPNPKPAQIALAQSIDAHHLLARAARRTPLAASHARTCRAKPVRGRKCVIRCAVLHWAMPLDCISDVWGCGIVGCGRSTRCGAVSDVGCGRRAGRLVLGASRRGSGDGRYLGSCRLWTRRLKSLFAAGAVRACRPAGFEMTRASGTHCESER